MLKRALFPIAIIFLSVVVVYIFQDTLWDGLTDLMERGRPGALSETEKKELALAPTVDVTLYFGSAEGDMLVPVTAKVEKGATSIQTVRHVLRALIQGPGQESYTPVIPAGTGLRAVFPGPESALYVDFDAKFVEGHPGGAWPEMLTAQAVANTVLQNFGNLFDRVILLVDGQEALTVAGSYAITGPLRFREDVVSAVIRPDTSGQSPSETPAAHPAGASPESPSGQEAPGALPANPAAGENPTSAQASP